MATIDDDVAVRAGGADDLDSVMAVMDSAFGSGFGEAWTRSQLVGILPMAGVSLMLACRCEGDEVAGFFLSRAAADESELLLIAVRPSLHRRGIGQVLLDHFLMLARTEGARRVHLEVRDGNPAVAMYRSAGFAPVGRRRNYYYAADGQRFDAVTLATEV